MATRVRDRAACCGGMAERVSTRGLVRFVSQRLKYYIDVQRKEDSFDLSGASRNEAESSSFYMTCEISLEEIKKPDCASPQKRKEAKNIQRLDHYCKQHTPPLVISPDPHEYEAKSIDVFCFKSTWETNKLEESNADFIQEDSRNDYGKNMNKGKKEKNIRNVNGLVRVERSSNISSNSSKHKSVLSKTSIRATVLNSLYLSTISPYAQRTDRSKASKKICLMKESPLPYAGIQTSLKSKIQSPVLAMYQALRVLLTLRKIDASLGGSISHLNSKDKSHPKCLVESI
ncbi:uncharacterized protein LOC119862281 isoform X1 [Dermochelys coriacea]|uniref:uncharacterized protein LOC119862281 isoform X1 n=1 Tax=Dermochelys coriacea TaxID=27794 RepID=UPI001CA8F85B|nr:uncharacterized protein LOC119862281 isoform X1 [Dermochelys coriacea]